ncbi:MAG: response regulator [Deltaproteobacteria bacterium]|nr:MAG: response regulator [Deltaproteobacteria bacterium]
MKRVLVVEDNDANLYLMRFIFEKYGFQVLLAESGAEGVEKAITEKPDLIIMDIQLPDISGYETTKKIRESNADRDIPIVALTSYAMAGDREKAFAAGCNGYIAKPINPETFMKEIRTFITI